MKDGLMRRKTSVATLALLLALIPTTALAAPPGPPAPAEPALSVTKEFEQVDGDRARGKDKAHVQQHVDETMRTSGLVSADDVEVWTAEVDGSEITAVIPEGSTVESAATVTDEVEGTEITGFGMEIAETEESVGTAPPVAHLEGRGTPLREYCRTIWFDARSIASGDDQVYDCYEKYKISNSSYIYNRYAKGTLANGGVQRREFHEFTIRFRQHKNFSRITGGPYNYGPLPSSTECGAGQFSYGGVTIPLTSCASIKNLAGGSYFATGTRYTGHAQGQKYVDTYARYTTNGSEPYFADYVWLTIGQCGQIGVPCAVPGTDYSVSWTDGNYYR